MAMDMPQRRWLMGSVVSLVAAGVLSPGMAVSQAVQPAFECVDSGALRVTCQGRFLDGSSAAGIAVRVYDKADHLVYVGTVDRSGRFSFRKPDADFHIVFDAGHGKLLTVVAADIT